VNGKPEDVNEDHIGFLVRNARNVSDVARLQAIVRTLAEFEEVVDKNSRSKSNGLPMPHYLRRAFAAAEPAEVRAVVGPILSGLMAGLTHPRLVRTEDIAYAAAAKRALNMAEAMEIEYAVRRKRAENPDWPRREIGLRF
jgi:hypothetical protein